MIFSLEHVFRIKSPDILVKKNERTISVENCLSSFTFNDTFEEKIIKCQYCHKKTNVFNKKSFATLPKYLIMLMSRGMKDKFNCHVKFEENLDLDPSYLNVKGIEKEKNTNYTLLGGTILYGYGYGHAVAFISTLVRIITFSMIFLLKE